MKRRKIARLVGRPSAAARLQNIQTKSDDLISMLRSKIAGTTPANSQLTVLATQNLEDQKMIDLADKAENTSVQVVEITPSL